ncbi:MAG: hypothetical protein ABJA02_01215 [Acidobacteriota bacterium]
MNQPKLFSNALFLIAIFALAAAAASAQPDRPVPKEGNFEVALQVVQGSDDPAARSELPSSLANVSKQIRSAIPYTSYRITNTYLARVANTGSFEYKSVGDRLGQTIGSGQPSFLEWSIGGLQLAGDGSTAQSFRFGARVPVKTTLGPAETGGPREIFNYEPIGLNLARVSVADKVPTLLGTLMLPSSNSTLFLIVTITRTER